MKLLKKVIIKIKRAIKLVKWQFKEPKKLYYSIDTLPIWNFYKVIETNNLKYMARVNDYSKPFKYDKKAALMYWEHINDEYLNFFRVSQDLLEVLELQAEAAVNQFEWVVNKNPLNKSLWKQATKKLEELLREGDNNETVLQKQIFYIEREMNFSINEKEVSVKRFFSYIKELNDYAKAIKNKQNNG